MNVLLMLAHSIEEWHQVQLMHELGHQVFSIGAYIDPARPGDDKRPALPGVPFHEDLAKVVWRTPAPNGDSLWAAKDELPPELLEWADVIICHHVEWRWLLQNWPRIRAAGVRAIWRTVGQSTHENEARMSFLRREGLEIVRYSPNERIIPGYAGEDALIRFWVDPEELSGWTGESAVIGNVTQNLRGRGVWTGYPFWAEATRLLPARPAGPGSEELEGLGALSYVELKRYLRSTRAYLYLGTFPASYTLGLLEAMMTGTPIVVASKERWRADFGALPYAADLFEAGDWGLLTAFDARDAWLKLAALLEDEGLARSMSELSRATALRLFSKDLIREEWRDYLDG